VQQPAHGTLRAVRFLPLALIILFVSGCGPLPYEEGAPSLDEQREPIDGIVFVHGISGSEKDWRTMVERFKADGFPEDRLIARTYEEPTWACNTSNAETLRGWVQELKDRGARHIAIIAHSMGGLSARYYVQRLGGSESVDTFITLGTMHHGLLSSCLSPVSVCVWKELCSTGAFLADLNAEPATPGPTRWVSIFSGADAIVPAASSHLDGAWNINLEGLAHDGKNGLQKSAVVYERVKSAL
jgi:triacylglycerol lipase